MSLTRSILDQLEPYWDRIARRPLSATALKRLEAKIGLPLPGCLCEYLLTVGFFQDLTNVESNAVLIFESITEYTAARQDLLDGVYGEIDMKLVPFGHNGSGDLFALRERADDDADVYFIRQDAAGTQPTGTTFTQWLSSVVNDALAQIATRATNRHKVWSVQFAFRGADFDTILHTMQQVGQVTFHSSEWENQEALPAGVRKATVRMNVRGLDVLVKRLEYPHWVSPWYFFDVQEPLDTQETPSTIQRLDDAFFEQIPGYGMINHGAVLRN
jgi:hypothetical protein